jgi:hypothetical protein
MLCCYDGYRVYSMVMLSVIMLNVVMLSVVAPNIRLQRVSVKISESVDKMALIQTSLD